MRNGYRKTERFLADLSHEVRGPLHAIVGFTDLLRDETLGELNSQQHLAVDDIRSAAEFLLRLTNNTLDISRLSIGALKIEREVLCLRQLVDSSLHMARGLAHEHDIGLECDIPPDLAVLADECRTRQILHNLLTNAIHFSPPHTVVHVRAVSETMQVWTLVEDEGPGIDQADRECIFEPFVTLKSPYAEPGTGLGLPVCQRLVQAMGGRIEIVDGQSAGACFRFSLPRAERPKGS